MYWHPELELPVSILTTKVLSESEKSCGERKPSPELLYNSV